jgi:hypothetical protein
MSQSHFVLPNPSESEKIIIMPPLETPPSAEALLERQDPEQAKAVAAVFEAKEKENAQVEGLLGLWMGTALLNDLATETFSEPAGDVEVEEEKPKKKKK